MKQYMNRTIFELHKSLTDVKVTVPELINEAIKNVENDEFNCYEANNFKEANKVAKNKIAIDTELLLDGIPFVLKDNFCTKGIVTSASSNSLSDSYDTLNKSYVPLYDATVYAKLKKAGAVMIAKTSMDELAMGGTGTTSHIGPTLNPLDTTRIIGGSSSGSCAAVVAGHVPFAIGSDTGDSVRKPASYGGLVGFKPTYGLISRYGMIGFAQSMDTVGYFTRNVLDSAILTQVLAGYDKNDYSSYKGNYDKNFVKNAQRGFNNKNLCYFPQLVDNIENKQIVDAFYKLVDELQKNGIHVVRETIDDRLLEAIYPTYMIISCAEASSNCACLDGIKYGPAGNVEDFDSYISFIKNNRTKGFSDMIKRRFIVGSYSLLSDNQEEVFKRAQKARYAIVQKMKEIFSKYDGMIAPASGQVAPKINEVNYRWSKTPDYVENHMAIANFGGFPSITVPMTKVDSMPVGVNLTCDIFKDSILLGIARTIEKISEKELENV